MKKIHARAAFANKQKGQFYTIHTKTTSNAKGHFFEQKTTRIHAIVVTAS
jgi:hypothetical protein